MSENQSDQSQQPLDLTLFSKELFSEHATFDLEKNPNAESYFEPIPNNFYGFCIPIPNGIFAPANIFGDTSETIDIDYEDLTIKKLSA